MPADIIVDGEIEAGTHQIIEPNYVPFSYELRNRTDLAVRLSAAGVGATGTFGLEIPGMGRLLLRSNRIKQVHPEWWGAEEWFAEATEGLVTRFNIPTSSEDHPNFLSMTSPDPDRAFARIDATAALQACFDAAHRLRATGSVQKAAIPIVMSGRYLTSRPLLLGRRMRGWHEEHDLAGLSRPFILRGRAAPSESAVPTLQANEGFVSPAGVTPGEEDHTLLYVRGPRGFLLENVAMSGRAARSGEVRAFSCLRVERDPGAVAVTPGRPSSELQMARLRRCVFQDAHGCLVQLGDYEHPYFEHVTPGSM